MDNHSLINKYKKYKTSAVLPFTVWLTPGLSTHLLSNAVQCTLDFLSLCSIVQHNIILSAVSSPESQDSMALQLVLWADLLQHVQGIVVNLACLLTWKNKQSIRHADKWSKYYWPSLIASPWLIFPRSFIELFILNFCGHGYERLCFLTHFLVIEYFWIASVGIFSSQLPHIKERLPVNVFNEFVNAVVVNVFSAKEGRCRCWRMHLPVNVKAFTAGISKTHIATVLILKKKDENETNTLIYRKL